MANTRVIGLLCGLIGSACSSPTNAEFVVVNSPVFNETGNYSDAFSTNGTTEYRTSWAQQFTLAQSNTTSSLVWWGGVNGFFGDGPNSITGFQIIVWNANFTQQIVNHTVTASQYTRIDSGQDNFFGSDVYEYRVPFVVNLASGVYNMNIGALYAMPGTGHDQFVWSCGALADTTPSYFTENASVNGQWGVWKPYLGGSFSSGGAFVLNAPSPSALALLGLAGIVQRRRR